MEQVKNRKKQRIIIAWIVLSLSVCVMAICGFQLREIKQTYQIGDEIYKELAVLVRSAGHPAFRPMQPADESLNESEPETVSKKPKEQNQKAETKIPGISIDFGVLQAINPDAVAWLYSPGTVIDYPVMKADDYSYYLEHLVDRTRNVNGSIFIDYNCAPDFSGLLTILYGHHMKSGGMMFGSLEEYKNQKYYQEHPFMYLYTEKESYRIDLLYGFVIGAGQWRDRAFMYEVNIDEFLAYAANNTTFESGAQYVQGDKIIAMSTCSYDFNDARYILIGVMRPEYDGK